LRKLHRKESAEYSDVVLQVETNLSVILRAKAGRLIFYLKEIKIKLLE